MYIIWIPGSNELARFSAVPCCFFSGKKQQNGNGSNGYFTSYLKVGRCWSPHFGTSWNILKVTQAATFFSHKSCQQFSFVVALVDPAEVQSLGRNGEDGTFLLMSRCPAADKLPRQLHLLGKWWEPTINGLAEGKTYRKPRFLPWNTGRSCDFSFPPPSQIASKEWWWRGQVNNWPMLSHAKLSMSIVGRCSKGLFLVVPDAIWCHNVGRAMIDQVVNRD